MNKIDNSIIWDKMDGRKMSAVMLKTVGNFSEKADWSNQYNWFKINLEKFFKYFKDPIKNL